MAEALAIQLPKLNLQTMQVTLIGDRGACVGSRAPS